ncbi:MAG: hypothetical protein R3F41_16980, partial [Gammaproteobacteria bacterium]
ESGMITLIELVMKIVFAVMMVSVMFYFGYSLAVSRCKSADFQGIWSSKNLVATAHKCFEGRHINQFIFIVRVFKYSFFTLIMLMVVQGVLGKFT